MRPIALGRPASNDPKAFERWVRECFAEVERASAEDISTLANDFSVSGHTPTHTLDAGTATLTDAVNVLCTLISDLQNRGMKRNQ